MTSLELDDKEASANGTPPPPAPLPLSQSPPKPPKPPNRGEGEDEGEAGDLMVEGAEAVEDEGGEGVEPPPTPFRARTASIETAGAGADVSWDGRGSKKLGDAVLALASPRRL